MVLTRQTKFERKTKMVTQIKGSCFQICDSRGDP